MSKLLNLINDIEVARSKLICAGMKKGLTHPETINCSKLLDELLNQYYQIGKRPSQ
ncbi:aspartyl-phosphate phosphatase Spo0E family protein [Evansella cellulosilytica]|uniref:Sporulation stage 0, Spo0E-like regulatory phosphatase n=1 Tax=Evansella cellulosilytica (strain ATCC 21833 / DSM 2522 / FERM P-1141 / JCM 9156 / N-4) TaxID=649639 RepID=E6TVX0_EVAC2|nr:aspartyl-phosphate phosphatase Spo0E family protein [Evansella cellulosilytica]ADU28679.1 Sporulation stage 0, Spo0E-like regulatory phosphatase [Evansella cellulosilytica DSM 2522]